AEVYSAYQARLDGAGLRDFRDLIADAIALLEALPNVAESLRRKYRYVLVDEFQDVDPAQFHLLRTLAPPWESPRLLVAGDPDQAIYGFRGTVPRLLAEDFGRIYGERSIHLKASHRCPPSVLAAGRSLLDATGTALAGTPAAPFASARPEPERGDPAVRVAREATAVDEAFFVAREIRRLMLDAPDLRPRDFAVLLRSTATLSAPFEEAIRALDLPYEVRGVGALARNEVVRFLLTYLRAVNQPEEPDSLERLLASGLSGVGQRAAGRLRRHAIEEGRAFAKVLRRLMYWLHGSDPEAWPLPWGEPEGGDAAPSSGSAGTPDVPPHATPRSGLRGDPGEAGFAGTPDVAGERPVEAPKPPEFAEYLTAEELRALHKAVSAYYTVVRQSRRLPLAALAYTILIAAGVMERAAT